MQKHTTVNDNFTSGTSVDTVFCSSELILCQLNYLFLTINSGLSDNKVFFRFMLSIVIQVELSTVIINVTTNIIFKLTISNYINKSIFLSYIYLQIWTNKME